MNLNKENTVHRRTWKALALTTTLAVTLSLAACGGDDDAGTGTDATIRQGADHHLVLQQRAGSGLGQGDGGGWNSAHPDQQVEGQEIPAGKSSEEVIGAAITAGTAPCLIFNTAPSAVGQFQRQGGLVNLATFPDGAATSTSAPAQVAEQYKAADGGYYQLPWKANPVMIFYNKDMFEKAGLDPENPDLSTYDEFLAAARKIKASGAAKFAIYPAPSSEFYQTQFDFMPMYAAETGGKGIVSDGKATFNDPAGIAVANFWKTVYDEGLAGKEAVQGDAFADKTAAMVDRRPVGHRGLQGQGRLGRGAGADLDRQAGSRHLHLQRCQERRPLHGLQEPGHRLGRAEVRDQRGAGRQPADQDRPDADAHGPAGRLPGLLHQEPALRQFGDQAARTVEVPGGPNTVEMLQTLRDAYTKAVISGEGDLQQSSTRPPTRSPNWPGRRRDRWPPSPTAPPAVGADRWRARST